MDDGRDSRRSRALRLASWGPSAVNAFSKLFGALGRVAGRCGERNGFATRRGVPVLPIRGVVDMSGS